MGFIETAQNARANLSRTLEKVRGRNVAQISDTFEEIIEHHKLDGFRFWDRDHQYSEISRYNPTGPMKDAYKGDNGKALYNLYADGKINPKDRLYGMCLNDPKGRLGTEFLFVRPLRPLIDHFSKSHAPRFFLYSYKLKRIIPVEHLINWRKFPTDECVSKEASAMIDEKLKMGAHAQDIIF